MKSSIKPYIIYIIIILAFYFLLISKKIKQNKEKDILEVTKEKSIYKIKKIISYYKTNKGFLRKLLINENKVTIKISGNKDQEVKILSDFGKSWYGNDFKTFVERSPPSQIKLNGKTSTFSTHKIKLEQDGLNTIELKWNKALGSLDYMFTDCQDIEWVDFSNFDFTEVEYLDMLMYDSQKIKYVNFGNHDFTKIEGMSNMFKGCSSLETVDNFGKTLNVKAIEYFFKDVHP